MPKAKEVDTKPTTSSTQLTANQKRLKWKLQKQKQRLNPEFKKKEKLKKREYREIKKVEDSLKQDEQNSLYATTQRQKGVIETLQFLLESQAEKGDFRGLLDPEEDHSGEFEEVTGWTSWKKMHQFTFPR